MGLIQTSSVTIESVQFLHYIGCVFIMFHNILIEFVVFQKSIRGVRSICQLNCFYHHVTYVLFPFHCRYKGRFTIEQCTSWIPAVNPKDYRLFQHHAELLRKWST